MPERLSRSASPRILPTSAFCAEMAMTLDAAIFNWAAVDSIWRWMVRPISSGVFRSSHSMSILFSTA
jgi:hypothetical protein